MKRFTSPLFRSLARTLVCALPATLLAGCSMEQPQKEELSESAATLGVEVPTCSDSANSGFTASSQVLALTMTGVTNSLVLGVVNGYVTVNGYPCVKSAMDGGAKLTPTMVKKISVVGTTSADKVVLDTLSGAFGTILSTTGGITVDLAGGTDDFSLRGGSGADKWSAGEDTGVTYFEITGDKYADVMVSNGENFAISLSAGNDTFTGQGGAIIASHLAGATLTTLSPVTTALTINGGDGDDVITGGNGNDVINGGEGNDTFKAAATDGDDTFSGGNGTDKADYSARTADLTIVMDGTTDSGEGSEADHIGLDVEDLVGGSGNDTLTGNVSSNHIQGGAGNDKLSGGVNGGACTDDVDILDGNDNDDTFDEGSAADCGDTINGGAGNDVVDYQGRSNTVNVSLDSSANDGESGEKDNVKTDVEIVLGGAGDDVITGSSTANELHGGAGNDTISGGGGNDILVGDAGNDTLNGDAGDDVFVESGTDALYTGTPANGAGNDIINGGTHDSLGLDTVDYSGRTAALTVTICMDSTKTQGASSSMNAECTDSDGDLGASEADNIINVTHIVGGTGNDALSGGSSADILEGGAGDDTLHGGAGNDTLYGDDGDDHLYGDAGDDYLDSGDHSMSGVDALDGDNVTNSGDGDVCIVSDGTNDTTANCEL